MRLKENKFLVVLLKEIVFSYLLTIGLILLMAALLLNFNYPDKMIYPSVLTISFFSIFASSYLLSNNEKTLISLVEGLFLGMLYYIILIFIGLIFNGKPSNDWIKVFAICTLTGGLGGLIKNFKVPLKSNKKNNRKKSKFKTINYKKYKKK